jgi:tetratricopeptide (TPR) repeat protein
VDTQTRHTLKNDKFALAAANSANWFGEHRADILRWAIGAIVVLVVVIGGLAWLGMRSASANTALGAAMDVYGTPLAVPGEPVEAGVYTSGVDRAKEANREFVAVAHNFRGTPIATKARYFAGVTYAELGQAGNAETELTAASHAWNRDLANLAKLALAGVYRQNSRDGEAIELYNQIAAKPSSTVTAAVAQLNLADVYAAEGKTDQARTLWAKIKDADKDGAAGSIADQKLSPKQ